VSELINHWRHFQTTIQYSSLSLQTNVFGPLNEVSQISFGLDVAIDTKIAWSFFKERIVFLCNSTFFNTTFRASRTLDNRCLFLTLRRSRLLRLSCCCCCCCLLLSTPLIFLLLFVCTRLESKTTTNFVRS
jgi:hypothetical protein